LLLALDGAQAVGAFPVPWRAAYYNLVEGQFARVYVAARLLSVGAALVTIWLLWSLPPGLGGSFCAILVALSPAHMLQSDQIRTDVTMVALLVLTLLMAARAHGPLPLGIAGGLTVAAKYSIVSAVAAIVAARSLRPRFLALAIGGSLAGFAAGAPYAL